jgi:hypothetical protein
MSFMVRTTVEIPETVLLNATWTTPSSSSPSSTSTSSSSSLASTLSLTASGTVASTTAGTAQQQQPLLLVQISVVRLWSPCDDLPNTNDNTDDIIHQLPSWSSISTPRKYYLVA